MGTDEAPFKMFGTPISPGAFFYFDNVYNLYPIIMSYSRLDIFENADRADRIIVNPGYKVIVYNDPNYTGTYQTIDNTNGETSELVNLSNTNANSSVRLYYGSTELSGSLSTSDANSFSPVNSSAAPTPGTNKIVPYTLKGSTIPAFCPVYMTGAYGSYPIFHSIANYIDYGMNDSDDRYLVAPHFTIIVWEHLYTGAVRKYENDSDDWKVFDVPGDQQDRGTSCKLYYYGTEITNT